MNTEASDESQLPASAKRMTQWGVWTLVGAVIGFTAWASWAPLDEGVPTQGVITVDTKRKAVQHLSGGIIAQVLVREGDQVQQGQPLIRLDNVAAQANQEASRLRYLHLRATQARLEAERAGHDTIDFGETLVSLEHEPAIADQLSVQRQLLRARQQALSAASEGLRQNILGQRASLQAQQQILTKRTAQLESLHKQLLDTQSMVREGYLPRNRELELQRQVTEVEAQIAETIGNQMRLEHTVAEMSSRLQALQEDHRKEVRQQLADVTRDAQAEEQRWIALQTDLQRVDITAPASGQVIGLVHQTVGGVVQPGQKIMDIVPKDEGLILEARVPPHLIDKIQNNLKVDVRFNAFSHSPQLVVEGQVASVSSDLLSDAQTGVTYYLARVNVTAEGMKVLGSRQMQAGMPAELIIKTGERSLLTYLLHPLTKRLAASLKEE
jgi:membrane fusion protein, protease secretion system